MEDPSRPKVEIYIKIPTSSMKVHFLFQWGPQFLIFHHKASNSKKPLPIEGFDCLTCVPSWPACVQVPARHIRIAAESLGGPHPHRAKHSDSEAFHVMPQTPILFSLFSSEERFHSPQLYRFLRFIGPFPLCDSNVFCSSTCFLPCLALTSFCCSVSKHHHLPHQQPPQSVSSMYPRVKVREEEEEKKSTVVIQEDRSSSLLTVLESLYLQDRCSPEIEHQSTSPPHARIPKSYVPNTPTPSLAVSKGTLSKLKPEYKKEIDVDNRINIRASSIPRPRAVLSSPVNDGMIGSRNKLRERKSVLKTRNSGQETFSQGKTNLKKDSPANTRRVSKELESKPQQKKKLATELTFKQQTAYPRMGKQITTGL